MFDAYCVSTRFPFSQHKNVSKIGENGFESRTKVEQSTFSPPHKKITLMRADF